ncbi:hypothetical protein ABZP36_007306, partial [Zizania latifolia]
KPNRFRLSLSPTLHHDGRSAAAARVLQIFTLSSSFLCAASRAIKRAGCFHERGREQREACGGSSRPYMLIYGALQIVFSQIPDMDKIGWLSIVASVMSFSYSAIGISLGVAQVICK